MFFLSYKIWHMMGEILSEWSVSGTSELNEATWQPCDVKNFNNPKTSLAQMTRQAAIQADVQGKTPSYQHSTIIPTLYHHTNTLTITPTLLPSHQHSTLIVTTIIPIYQQSTIISIYQHSTIIPTIYHHTNIPTIYHHTYIPTLPIYQHSTIIPIMIPICSIKIFES